jgi:ribonuclease HI
MTHTKKSIEIYTDGSARGNPGPAGWGSVIIDHVQGSVVELGGRFDMATNNRMELLALHDSLVYIEGKKLYDTPITFFIDSAYVQKGVTLWMYGWERNGWKTASKGDVLNQDLWQEIFFLVFRLKRLVTMKFEKVAGHAGDFGNERADTVATSYALSKPTLLYKGPLAKYMELYEIKK